jgi:hypothetical protein
VKKVIKIIGKQGNQGSRAVALWFKHITYLILGNIVGKYASIVGVLHEDLHSDFEVKAIERVAYTVVASVPLPDVMGVDVHGCYEIIQKRKSGKVSRVVSSSLIFEIIRSNH